MTDDRRWLAIARLENEVAAVEGLRNGQNDDHDQFTEDLRAALSLVRTQASRIERLEAVVDGLRQLLSECVSAGQQLSVREVAWERIQERMIAALSRLRPEER